MSWFWLILVFLLLGGIWILPGAVAGQQAGSSYPWHTPEEPKTPIQATVYKEGVENYAFQAIYLLKQIQLLDPEGLSKSETTELIERNRLEKHCVISSNEIEVDPVSCISRYRDTLASQVKQIERRLEEGKLMTGELEDSRVKSKSSTLSIDGTGAHRKLPVAEISYVKGKKPEVKVRVPYIPSTQDLAKAQKGFDPFTQKQVALDSKNQIKSGNPLFRTVPLEYLNGKEFEEFVAKLPPEPKLADYRRYEKVEPGGDRPSYVAAIPCKGGDQCYDMEKFKSDKKLYDEKFSQLKSEYSEMLQAGQMNRNLAVTIQGEAAPSIESLYLDKQGRLREDLRDTPETYQAFLSARAALVNAGNQAVEDSIKKQGGRGLSSQSALSSDQILQKIKLDQALSKEEQTSLRQDFYRLRDVQVQDPNLYSASEKDRKNIYLTLEPEDIRKALEAVYAPTSEKAK